MRKRSAFLFRNKGLLWKLCGSIAAGTVLLFWSIDLLVQRTEQRMSHISEHHRQELNAYGREAERIFSEQGETALAEYLLELQERESTWAAVVHSNITPLAGSDISAYFNSGILLGRSTEWKIHLYFEFNPVIEVPFIDKHHHFLIRLPQRMRPGAFFPLTQLLLQIALPLVLMILLSVVLYRHVMNPLRQLEKATRQFSEGQFDVRVKNYLGVRDDELAALAETFDHMAERTGTLILTQRQLLGDLSHELRTPLARMDMALDCIEAGINPKESLDRLRYEASTMRELVQDALTLAWLNNESPTLDQEEVDLNELLQLIVEDANFEYPDHPIQLIEEAHIVLEASSHRALGQACENIIRNALKHSIGQCPVQVLLSKETAVNRASDTGIPEQSIKITVRDQGGGVPEALLNNIFEPFFRVDKARSSDTSSGIHPESTVMTQQCSETEQKKSGGYGLGLALAKRQIIATGGNVRAQNIYSHDQRRIGLEIKICLPASEK